MSEADIATTLIRKHEGLRLKPYHCTAGKLTIGYGTNIEDRGITIAEADAMLAADVAECVRDLQTMRWWSSLNDARKAALIDMRYNLGGAGLRGFKKLLDALTKEDFARAATEARNSRWAAQVGNRAKTIAQIIQTGELPA